MMNLVFEAVVLIAGLMVVSIIPLTNSVVYGSLVFLTVVCYAIARKYGISLSELGFTTNFKKTLLPWTTMTLGLLLLLVVAKSLYPGGLFTGILTNRRAFIYIIPMYTIFGSFMQEFVFRGYFFARVKPYMSVATVIILNIIIFSLFHLPYIVHFRSNLFYLSIAGGILWSIYYAKYPNLYLAWMSHALVGATTLLLLQRF